ncbi:MAG: DNA repair protein RadC [Halanaerobium sp.]|nr:DNA repair protein RadC [Halanaerobium sp.]
MTAESFTIKELPVEQRPREKLLRKGTDSLTNEELLAIIIRTGARNETAMELARRLVASFGGLRSLTDVTCEELMEVKGIGLAKATQIAAVIELAKRLATTGMHKIKIRSPQDAARLLLPGMRYLKKEVFKVILLDTKNQLIAVEKISQGGLNSSIVHPREVFKPAIKRSCCSLIAAHNHPSGDVEPSQEDIQVTKRLQEGASLLGFDFLDHLIIGDGQFMSLKEEGYI